MVGCVRFVMDCAGVSIISTPRRRRNGEVWAYSAQNMKGSLSRTFSTPTPDDNDGVDVEYIDGRTFQKRPFHAACLASWG
ncbi:hypothetical protein ACPA9J_27580 [Pseudomonas aeruginosa]